MYPPNKNLWNKKAIKGSEDLRLCLHNSSFVRKENLRIKKNMKESYWANSSGFKANGYFIDRNLKI